MLRAGCVSKQNLHPHPESRLGTHRQTSPEQLYQGWKWDKWVLKCDKRVLVLWHVMHERSCDVLPADCGIVASGLKTRWLSHHRFLLFAVDEAGRRPQWDMYFACDRRSWRIASSQMELQQQATSTGSPTFAELCHPVSAYPSTFWMCKSPSHCLCSLCECVYACMQCVSVCACVCVSL